MTSSLGVMRSSTTRWSALVIALGLTCSTMEAAESTGEAPKLEYNRDIRPILSDNCFACHGPDARQRKASLRLDQRDDATKERDGHAVITPGDPNASELLERIVSEDQSLRMPPQRFNKTLTARQIEMLRLWISQGAEYQPHWAFIAPTRPPVPTLKYPSLVRNPVDAFIQQMLEQRGVTPSPEADRRVLIRRVSLDLTGLPPTPDQVEVFLLDAAPNAYETLVDRLMRQPAYGERMATPWLDVVRYSDTVGYHGDQNQNSWAYRDYVIASFNANKPFDQFTREQLAGDLLPRPTPEQLVATCFNRLNMVTREGGAQPKEYLAKSTADRIRTVGMAWMGSTLGCCECHDHKFDPFTTKDFYSLGAFFADIKQWGVYSDYSYTPNPDLKGWSNEHPFPPEIQVESPALQQRLETLRVKTAGVIQSLTPESSSQNAWKSEILAFLTKNPRGWETPTPKVIVEDPKPKTANGATPKTKKGQAKAKAKANSNTKAKTEGKAEDPPEAKRKPGTEEKSPTGAAVTESDQPKAARDEPSKRDQAKAKDKAAPPIDPESRKADKKEPKPTQPEAPPKPAPPAFEVDGEGRIVFSPTAPPATTEIEIQPTPGFLATIRLELIPDPRHGGKILRQGTETLLRPTFSLTGGDPAKPRPLAVRHAQANHATPRYDNGFEIIGVQSGWKIEPPLTTQPLAAIYFLDPPVRIGTRELLKITLPGNALGCLRVSCSPLAPLDPGYPSLPGDLAIGLNDPFLARAFQIRSTAWDAQAYGALKRLDAEILNCRDGKTPVMVVERTNQPLVIRVLKRGNWMDESGEVCAPAPPAFLPGGPKPGDKPWTRLDLADWLCSPKNPLTARVFVNRLWKQFFGTGLSAQVDDLGLQGEPPSHPQLLDWLAVEFRERGWDTKHLVKLIVMSHTYRQAAQARPELRESDPNNRLLASQNPRRLEAEAVRDNALAISGSLNRTVGGPPCKPYQPADYYEGLQFPDRVYQADPDERQWRRGVYMHWQRTFLHPMLANFDAPSREDCIALRSSANSPQQALTLLNDPTFVEAARVWARRLLSVPGLDDAKRLSLAFEQALSRPIRDQERTSLLEFLGKVRSEYSSRKEDAEKLEKIGVAPVEAGDPVEAAAWTNVCRVILNLHETITRY